MTEQRYAGGGIVRELLEGVAKEAPELARGTRAATRRATINVGLDINGGEKLSPDEVLAALQSFGVKPVRAAVHQSDTEPTLVIELDRSLNAQEAHKLSMDLRQEAIAQVDEYGVGDLHGPSADNWKPFNGDYFIDNDGRRLSQAIMDAGEGEKPGYAGGGLVKRVIGEILPLAKSKGVELRIVEPKGKYKNRIGIEWIERKTGDKGAGREVMLHLNDLADRADLPIDLSADVGELGYDHPLVQYYSALGFDDVSEAGIDDGLLEMSREPRWKPGYAGGGIIREAVEGLLEAAGRNADEAADLAKPMRLYHGTKRTNRRDKGFAELSPDVRPSQLGLHLGNQKQADYFASDYQHLDDTDLLLNKDHYARNAPVGGRVIPLDVTVKNPIRLEDRTGKWHPSEIYSQLAEQGKVEYNQKTWDNLYDLENADSEAARDHAMRSVRRMIEEAGHDGVIYTNRVEGFVTDDPVRQRFKQRGIMDESSLKDNEWLDVVPEARGNDSYIVWDQEQYRSPFGDGPGAAGYAGGGVVRKLGQGLVDMLDFSGVGKPRTVKIPGMGEHAALPIAEIDDAAEAYMRKAGIPGTHRIDEYPAFDEDRARRLAEAYDAAKHAPNDPEVKRAYEALIDETVDQYKALKDTGLDIRFLKDGMEDPYAASPAMGYADMVENGRLWVFPTSQGYGSLDDIADNPLLKKVGKVGDLEDATANDAFRVVHDAYGHFGPGNPFFRHAGEDRAWMHHGRMFSDDALPAMTAETRGQNSWLNFGPYGEQNRKALGADTIFADQKATIMPPWAYEEVRKRKYADGGPVWSEEDIASMTHDHSYGTGRDMNYLETLGTKIPLGETNFYDVDGERRMPEGIQGLHDVGRLGIYAVPGVGPFIGAGLDTAEAIAEDDPLSAGMAVAFGPGGKLAKGAMTGTMAMGMDPAEAEAGLYGKLSKWGQSAEGRSALDQAEEMLQNGFSMREIRDRTKWELDTDGHWKFWLPSKGGGTIEPFRGSTLEAVYKDPFLFDQYPHMRDIGFSRMNDEGAYWDAPNERIVLGDTSKPAYNEPDAGGRYGALTHEIYHAKSSHEGWPQGTSVLAAKMKMTDDLRGLHNIPRNSPIGGPKDPLSKVIGGEENFSPLGYKRYRAEMGEALARREAAMREMDYDNFGPYTVADQIFIDMPKELLFQPGQPPMKETYDALLKMVDDERVAADMQKAAAAKPKPKPKGRR